MPPTSELRRTPLFELHRDLGARLVPFAGWEMPVQYAGVIQEHRAVREAVGLFDVSHMGEIEVTGPEAVTWLQRMTPNDVAALEPGQVHYSALLTERGTFIDDLLVYRLAERRFMLVVNAGNRECDLEWLREHLVAGVELDDISDRTALLAVQGPRAAALLERMGVAAAGDLHPFRCREVRMGDVACLLSRTGYTGEDGFEIYVDTSAAATLFSRFLDEGSDDGLVPVGLGARDTLRLEAALCLCGQDIDDTTTPLEAGLSFIVKLGTGPFVGSEILERQHKEGITRRLTGFRLIGRGVARHGHTLQLESGETFAVTSGSHAPSLGQSIGLAYLPAQSRSPGTPVKIIVRDRPVEAELVKIPFYRRPPS